MKITYHNFKPNQHNRTLLEEELKMFHDTLNKENKLIVNIKKNKDKFIAKASLVSPWNEIETQMNGHNLHILGASLAVDLKVKLALLDKSIEQEYEQAKIA